MGQKPWKHTMHYEKESTNTMGKEILDHPINTLWRSPHKKKFHTFYSSVTFSHIAHRSSTPFHIVCWLYSIQSLIQTPVDNHRWRKLENHIVEAIRPHPQTAAMAHFIKVCCICFIKIRKSKNICCCLLVRQGWVFHLHDELYLYIPLIQGICFCT